MTKRNTRNSKAAETITATTDEEVTPVDPGGTDAQPDAATTDEEVDILKANLNAAQERADLAEAALAEALDRPEPQEVAGTVTGLQRAAVVAALHKIDKRYRPNPLPVREVIGWLATLPSDERDKAIILLDAVCMGNQDEPIGTSWQVKVEALLALVNTADEAFGEAAPALTPAELAARIAPSNPHPQEIQPETVEMGQESEDGDFSSQSSDPLDTFTNPSTTGETVGA